MLHEIQIRIQNSVTKEKFPVMDAHFNVYEYPNSSSCDDSYSDESCGFADLEWMPNGRQRVIGTARPHHLSVVGLDQETPRLRTEPPGKAVPIDPRLKGKRSYIKLSSLSQQSRGHARPKHGFPAHAASTRYIGAYDEEDIGRKDLSAPREIEGYVEASLNGIGRRDVRTPRKGHEPHRIPGRQQEWHTVVLPSTEARPMVPDFRSEITAALEEKAPLDHESFGGPVRNTAMIPESRELNVENINAQEHVISDEILHKPRSTALITNLKAGRSPELLVGVENMSNSKARRRYR